jgi:hypothetical protein
MTVMFMVVVVMVTRLALLALPDRCVLVGINDNRTARAAHLAT